jgi:hypothetical protein
MEQVPSGIDNRHRENADSCRAYDRAHRVDVRDLRRTKMEATRCLKRRLSDIVYQQMLRDALTQHTTGPGGHRGTSTKASVAGSHPHTDTSEQSLPRPAISNPNPPIPAVS